MYIVIVEDNPTDAQWITQVLQSQAHEVVTCGTAAEGWTVIQGREPDVVVMDYRLPDAAGWQLARRIRESYPRFTIIATSAYLDVGAVIDGFRLGIDDVLLKPIKSEDLLARVWEARLHRQGFLSLPFTGSVPSDRSWSGQEGGTS